MGGLSQKISHIPNGFGLGNILGLMESAEHSFVLVNLVSCTLFRIFVIKAIPMAKVLTFKLF